MNELVEKIKSFFGDEENYFNIKIQVDEFGISIIVDEDPESTYDENCMYCIRYDTLDNAIYIPDDYYREHFHPNDYGIMIEDIVIIHKIMDYIKENSEEIDKMCNGLGWVERNKQLEDKGA